MFLNELPPGFHVVAHEDGEDAVGFGRIFEHDLEQFALFGIHRGFEKLFRVHLAESFVSLDGDAFAADFADALQQIEEGVDGFFPLS
jgi:hypothetical protein